jgi:hypothetical protein
VQKFKLTFSARPDKPFFVHTPEQGLSDAEIEHCLAVLEYEVGPLPREPRTDFPCFDILDADGNFVMGG